ncbi:hypothetical protein BR63_03395 [Thermanaerosceptrum fracticalcis]|uniref:Uncharacterized protein n=1 Tax=Thermanaerosceptrum fracticalcis TaxID=1712410 RepID=A0A7G6E041_THEFR|nr:hypothetical protein [Thermanaerosceptrum fracticalcis]QNB45445.1 hypothetical protein BR63_03395 [Thermanaerosceptrum fracticalcis]
MKSVPLWHAFEKYGFNDGELPGADDAIEEIINILEKHLPEQNYIVEQVSTCCHNDYINIIYIDKNGNEIYLDTLVSIEHINKYPALVKELENLVIEIEI